MKNAAVAGYIRINDGIYLYAVVEGAVSGQLCFPTQYFHFQIPPPQHDLPVNKSHIFVAVRLTGQHLHVWATKNVPFRGYGGAELLLHKQINLHDLATNIQMLDLISAVWKGIYDAISFFFFFLCISNEWKTFSYPVNHHANMWVSQILPTNIVSFQLLDSFAAISVCVIVPIHRTVSRLIWFPFLAC